MLHLEKINILIYTDIVASSWLFLKQCLDRCIHHLFLVIVAILGCDLWGQSTQPDTQLLISDVQRWPWCNGYRRWKWTRRQEFKSWTRLMAFHIALIPLGKVWIQLFSLQLWANSRAATSLGEGKFKPVKFRLKIDVVSYPSGGVG